MGGGKGEGLWPHGPMALWGGQRGKARGRERALCPLSRPSGSRERRRGRKWASWRGGRIRKEGGRQGD